MKLIMTLEIEIDAAAYEENYGAETMRDMGEYTAEMLIDAAMAQFAAAGPWATITGGTIARAFLA